MVSEDNTNTTSSPHLQPQKFSEGVKASYELPSKTISSDADEYEANLQKENGTGPVQLNDLMKQLKAL